MARKRPLPDSDRIALSLYQTVQDPAALPEFVGTLMRAFQSHVGALHVFDHRSDRDRTPLNVGLGDAEAQEYAERYGSHNLWIPRGMAALREHGLVDCAGLADDRELRGNPWYARFLVPTDIRYALGFCLWHDAQGQMALISVNRSRRVGSFTQDELAVAQRLVPHFRCAYALAQQLGWAETRATSLQHVVDRLGVGVVMFDAAGKFVHANAAADTLLRAGLGLHWSTAGGIAASNAGSQRALDQAIAGAASGTQLAPVRIGISDPAGVERVACLVCTLPGDRWTGSWVTRARLAVYLHAVALARPEDDRIWQRAFGLTAAEARLARRLVAGRSMAGAARDLGIAISTARSQLKALMAKTRTHRQVELLAALDLARRSG